MVGFMLIRDAQLVFLVSVEFLDMTKEKDLKSDESLI